MAPAPDTKSKEVMVAATRTEVENWCCKLAEDPDTCLRSGGKVIPFGLFRCKDIIDIYSMENNDRKPYEKTMSNALRKAGFDKAAHGHSCPTKDGKVNLWAIRDKKDTDRSSKEIGEKYDNERNIEPKKFQKGKK